MPPLENDIGELFMMNENGEPVKIQHFSEMPKCEVKIDTTIDLKSLYEAKYEGKIELTPESAAELAKLQKQWDEEIIENMQQQIKAVDGVIAGLKYCGTDDIGNCKKCQYYTGEGIKCTRQLLADAIAIAEAYRRVVESGLKMMEEK